MKNEIHKAENPEAEIKKEFFDYLESERKKIAYALQDDIAQVIFIAKMKLPEGAAPEADHYLNLALAKLRSLAFELKPEILERFGLAVSLQALLEIRFEKHIDFSKVNVLQLPLNMGITMETAVFRLVQEIISSIPAVCCKGFALHVVRIGHFICVKTAFDFEPLSDDTAAPSFSKEGLVKTVQSVLYFFSGHYHFYLPAQNRIEFSVCLDENKALLPPA